MEEDGLSLLDLWKLIMKKKLVVSITFGIIFIATLLFILYGYNPMRSYYEVKFNYQWIGIENKKYANGLLFNDFDIISLDHLNQVKKTSEDFSSIDTIKLSEQITLTYDEEEDKMYKIKVPASFFKGDRQVKAFIERLVYLPYQKALQLSFDFTANLMGYERSNKISYKLSYLRNQITLILEGYQGMISYFGDIQIGDNTLSGLLRLTEVFQMNDDLNNYEYIAYQNTYMTKEEYQSIVKEKEVLLTEQKLLRERKNLLLDSLRNIYSSSNGNTYMDTSIANYLNNLHKLDTRLMKISEDLTLMDKASLGNYSEEKSEEFLNTLESYKDKLKNLTKEYTDTVSYVLRENTIINMEPISVRSRISIWLAIPLSLALGIFLSFLLGFIWSYITENKKKERT